ncbi:hypothetical protein HispidOSU_027387 [Sigmodon hispidus]
MDTHLCSYNLSLHGRRAELQSSELHYPSRITFLHPPQRYHSHSSPRKQKLTAHSSSFLLYLSAEKVVGRANQPGTSFAVVVLVIFHVTLPLMNSLRFSGVWRKSKNLRGQGSGQSLPVQALNSGHCDNFFVCPFLKLGTCTQLSYTVSVLLPKPGVVEEDDCPSEWLPSGYDDRQGLEAKAPFFAESNLLLEGS